MLKRIMYRLGKLQTKTLKKFGEGIGRDELKVVFCDSNPEIAKTLALRFKDMRRVEVVEGNIFVLQGDAIISPTNSFGDMSGGLDKAIDDYFKGEAQKDIQYRIKRDYYGELQVGNAITIETDSLRYPNIIFAPTMRIPGPVIDTINAYLAMRALLIEAERKGFKKIIVPNLCSGIGRMPYEESSEQMFKAYENIVLGDWMRIVHPLIAPYASRKQVN